MTPSLDERLASMITAVAKTILPAIPGDESLAKEQAGLLLGHLNMLQQQLDFALGYERFEMEGVKRLANSLVDRADGGPKTQAAVNALQQALGNSLYARGGAEVRAATEALGAAIEALVDDGMDDATSAFRASIAQAIIGHERIWSMHDRAWFAGAGYEAAADNMPSIATLMDQLEREFGPQSA